jgi:MarR family transcriptional regulator, lower aerobic nicotinate degradation pathway regulator
MATRTSARPQLGTVDGLAQLSFAVHGTLERRAAEHDLSMIQTRLLGVLRDRAPSMNELAKLLLLDKSSITGLVDRAERRGLVARVPSTTDRRAILVSLSAKGRSLVSEVSTGFESDVVKMLACLSASDRKALSELVSKVVVAQASDRGVDLFASLT